MPRMKAPVDGRTIYTPTDSFVAEVDGVEQVFNPNKTFIREGHELLRGPLAHLFKPIRVHYETDVEQATAAPGELRG